MKYMNRILFKLILIITISLPGMATDRALLVGIGKYDREKTGWSQIHGDNDVMLLRPLLEKQGFTDIVCLTNEKETQRFHN